MDVPIQKPIQKKGRFWRKFWLIAGPLLVIVFFVIAMNAIIALNKKPEEKKRAFNTPCRHGRLCGAG